MGLLALGLGLGMGVALVRNLPQMPYASMWLVAVAISCGVAAAYFAGKRKVQSQWQFQIQQQEQIQDQKQAQQQNVAVYVGEGGRAAALAVVGPPQEHDHQLESSSARQLSESQTSFFDIDKSKKALGFDALDDVAVSGEVPVSGVVAAPVKPKDAPRTVARESDRDDTVGSDHV